MRLHFLSVRWASMVVGFVCLMSLSRGAIFALDLGMAKEDAGQPGQFLNFGASARSLAMGRAHTGVADDAGAGYWNPSGLAQLDQKNLVSLYSFLHMDTGYGFVGFAVPTVDYGTLGLNVITLNSGNFEKRQAGTGAHIGSFSQSDTAVLFSHGVAVTSRLSVGETLKVIHQNIDSHSDIGFGADLGLMWKHHPKFQTGLMIQNIWAPQMKLDEVTEEHPRQIRLGFGYRPRERFLLSMDVGQAERRNVKLNLGSEWRTASGLALRAGLNETELTAGLGFRLSDWSLDYALGYQQTPTGVESLGVSHRLGFSWSFGEKITDTGLSLKWQRRGKLVLQLLRQQMDTDDKQVASEIDRLVMAAQDVVLNQGFTRAQDLYAAQGYISFFKGEYERSVQALNEALALEPSDQTVFRHLTLARRQMTDLQTHRLVSQELTTMKEHYTKGDYASAAVSCHKVLSLMPDHVEASAYLEDIERRINEPIMRHLKIARTKIQRDEHLDAIKHLNIIKRLDPNNTQADALMASAIQALENKARLQSRSRLSGTGVRPVYVVQTDPNKSRQLYSQGLLLYSRGKLTEAVAIWEKAVHLDPDNQLARNAFNRGQMEIQDAKNH